MLERCGAARRAAAGGQGGGAGKRRTSTLFPSTRSAVTSPTSSSGGLRQERVSAGCPPQCTRADAGPGLHPAASQDCRAARQSGGGTPLQQVPGCRRAAANLGTPQEGRPLRAAPPSSRHTLLGKAAYYDQQEHGRSSARFCARRRMSVSARPQPQPRCRSRQRATGAFTEGGNRRGARRRN